MKFNEGDFVKQKTDSNHIKMIVAVDNRADESQMDRFTLQDVHGGRISNIGAYELKRARDAEVRDVLNSVRCR